MTLLEAGLFCELSDADFSGRPALFLDRDGVIVEDTRYLGAARDVRMISGSAAAIARCNRRGIPVVLVTNQSGVGRGYYGWADFRAVQRAIAAALSAAGGRFDAVMACAYHEDASDAFKLSNHPWRKPNPGMMLEAGARMNLDLARSWIVGDSPSDIEAGRAARLAGAILISTRGEDAGRTSRDPHDGSHFVVETSRCLADAVESLLAHGRLGV